VENADGPADDVAVYSGHHLLFEDLLGDQTRVHEVHVCGLEPNTVYYYKVGGKGAWSGIFETATAPELGTKDPISITLFGDSRNATEDLWPMTVKKISEGNPDLMLFSGDAVFLGTQQSLWNNFFEASTGDFRVQDLFSRVPFMSANGNHDALAVNYVAQFAFPQDPSPNEAAQGEEWYSFDYGNTHVAVLNDTVNDASVIGGSQASWLRADLGAVDRDKTPWVFVMHHRPFYTCLSTHRPDNALRDAWQDIFDEFKVDMVFTGHNHVYERSLPIRGLTDGQGQAAAAGPNGVPEVDGEGSPSGTIYIVSAGAGAETYAVSDECALSYTAASAHHYSTVEIEDRKITFTARNTMSDAVI
ncbi:MAG: metallophosphoesterase family protein, partial [Myxococcales bacterium]|nr:metallophosphoesterase family protein [Myxococcales bacterium]